MKEVKRLRFNRIERTVLIAIVLLLALGIFVMTARGTTFFNITLTNSTDLQNGLVSHWTFDGLDMDEGVEDISGNGLDGALNGQISTTTVIGRVGQALDFDGSDDYVTHGGTFPNAAGTIAQWVKPRQIRNMVMGPYYSDGTTATTYNGFSHTATILEVHPGILGSEFAANFQDGDGTTLNANGNWRITGGTPVAGEWAHVVMTWDTSDVLRLYVDGEQVNSIDISGGTFSGITSTVQQIGRVGDGTADRHWDGVLDDVRIYNRALSAREVEELYGLGATTHINTTLGDADTGSSLSSGLVGHWTFDGPDMDEGVEDISGNGNNGTLYGQTSTTTVAGRLGQALEFDGDDDYVGIPQSSTVIGRYTNDMTVAAWMKSNTLSGIQRVVASARTNSANGIAFGANDSSLRFTTYGVKDYDSSGISLQTDVWYHIVAVLDSSNDVAFYVDGAYEETVTGTSPSNTDSDDTTHIGSGTTNGGSTLSELFDGTIDDVRIYNRALSAREVEELYGLGATTHINTTLGDVNTGSKIASGLVGHWTFDGPDMDAGVEDASGNGNNGTLSGQTSTTTAPGVLGQALQFDGSDDYVGISSFSESLLPATITVWAKVSAADLAACDGIVFSRSTNVSGLNVAACDAATKLGYHWNSAANTYSWTGGPTVPTDEWFLAALVVESSEARMYAYSASGVAAVGTNAVSHSASLFDDLQIGRDEHQTRLFKGDIDDVRIYNRALSAEEIARLYDLGR